MFHYKVTAWTPRKSVRTLHLPWVNDSLSPNKQNNQPTNQLLLFLPQFFVMFYFFFDSIQEGINFIENSMQIIKITVEVFL